MIRMTVPKNVKITYLPVPAAEKASLVREVIRAINTWLYSA